MPGDGARGRTRNTRALPVSLRSGYSLLRRLLPRLPAVGRDFERRQEQATRRAGIGFRRFGIAPGRRREPCRRPGSGRSAPRCRSRTRGTWPDRSSSWVAAIGHVGREYRGAVSGALGGSGSRLVKADLAATRGRRSRRSSRAPAMTGQGPTTPTMSRIGSSWMRPLQSGTRMVWSHWRNAVHGSTGSTGTAEF